MVTYYHISGPVVDGVVPTHTMGPDPGWCAECNAPLPSPAEPEADDD